MPAVRPTKALVRPRVATSHGRDVRPLEDVVAELADEYPPGVVWLVGDPGSGKSTAIAHLAELHKGDPRLAFRDAMEGSLTGFYTDDREETHFKRPEEIRKANLRGADLRGANVEGVDFYLVDLREALLDRDQEKQARRTGAILEDYDA